VNEWPSGWFRGDGAERGDGNGAASGGNVPRAGDLAGAGGLPGAAAAAGLPNDPTVRLPYGSGSAAGGSGYGASTRPAPSPWPDQPPARSAPGQRRPSRARGAVGGRRRRPRWRLILAFLAGLVVVALILVIGGYFYLDGKLARQNVLVSYAGQPAAGAGTNWLITGSDSRAGLTRAQKRQLHTGSDGGHRSDTILILHIPSNGGRAVLISLPRDSYVTIPGFGQNKINAAYSFGGPKLLAKTVQDNTGLRIEHYIGIGFGGLVNVVDAVGGVRMCLPAPIHDQASGLNLKAGCQTLDGAEALGYVRTRHQFANQDLQREQNQRLFLRALLRKMTSPTTLLNPFATVPAAFGAAGAVKVDNGTHLYQLLQLALALRNPETTTVPIANANYSTAAGDAVLWDNPRANRLFRYLNHDQPVPKSLLTGSHLAG